MTHHRKIKLLSDYAPGTIWGQAIENVITTGEDVDLLIESLKSQHDDNPELFYKILPKYNATLLFNN